MKSATIVAAQPKAMLLIVGEAPAQALHAKAQTRESIQAAADAAGVGEHLKFIGVITDYGDLGTIYRAADVHVFPVRHVPDDPEGFGMVAIEAAAHGLPTVAFATGGIVDAISEGNSGQLVANNDYADFAQSTLNALSQHQELEYSSRKFAELFSWGKFGQSLAHSLRLQGD